MMLAGKPRQYCLLSYVTIVNKYFLSFFDLFKRAAYTQHELKKQNAFEMGWRKNPNDDFLEPVDPFGEQADRTLRGGRFRIHEHAAPGAHS